MHVKVKKKKRKWGQESEDENRIKAAAKSATADLCRSTENVTLKSFNSDWHSWAKFGLWVQVSGHNCKRTPVTCHWLQAKKSLNKSNPVNKNAS